MNDKDKERDAIRAQCSRALSHETPHRRRPKRVLDELAALTGADVIPDAYGKGEVIASFEREVAALLGKEAAVFMPSGTMAQQIALRIWSDRKRIRTVAFHPKCHLEIHEEKGYQHLHGLAAKLVGAPQSLMTIADLEAVAEPISALLIELPQREIGGLLPAWSELEAIVEWAKLRGVALHLDGARFWESKPFYGRDYAEIAALFDSVYVSTYKGLGGIAGCLLAGAASFVAEARVWQRRHGGTLISLWPYVLAAKAGLAERIPKMPSYVAKARAIAPKLAAVAGLEVIPNPPHTNMFHVLVTGERSRIDRAVLEVAKERGVWMGTWVAATDSPSRWRVEINCGDATLALGDDEIVDLFQSMLDRTKQS